MRRRVVSFLLLGALLGAGAFGATPAPGETGKKALILGSSVTGGATSTEATTAEAQGFAVSVVDDAAWAAMTAAQFADFQLVIVGDPTCSRVPAVVSQNAKNLADAVMARAGGNTKAGNRILIGTDPVFHQTQGGDKLIDRGIAFAGVVDGATNLYLNTTCTDADHDGNGTQDVLEHLLPRLTVDPTPGWTENPSAPCGGDISLISNADQFSTLTGDDLRDWGCSVHMSFPTFPTDWTPLAVATDTPTTPTCGTDVDTGETRCGEAYILIAGRGITATAPNLALDPVTGSAPVNTQHTVTATVTNPDESVKPGQLVDFLITGVNAGAAGTCAPADCKTGPDGKVAFTYTGAAEGDDTINASADLDGSKQTATAAMTWTAALPPEPTPTPTATVTPVPTIDVQGDVVKSCSSRRVFKITIRKHGLRSVALRLNGKKVPAKKRGGRFRATIDLRNRGKETSVLRIRARTKAGKLLKAKRVYHPCTKKRKHKRPPRL